jgi:ribosomal protein S18 acetylase RimI-like enzyme
MLAAAFDDDPFWRAVGPPQGLRRRAVARLSNRIELIDAVGRGEPAFVACEGPRITGVVLTSLGSASSPLWATLHSTALGLGGPRTLSRTREIGHVITTARPREPHVYLAVLAVSPEDQGEGIGSRLTQRVAQVADERRLPITLETMRAQNLGFYSRLGFLVTGHTQLFDELDIWFLRREARKSTS